MTLATDAGPLAPLASLAAPAATARRVGNTTCAAAVRGPRCAYLQGGVSALAPPWSNAQWARRPVSAAKINNARIKRFDPTNGLLFERGIH